MSLNAMYPHRIRLRGPWECEPIEGVPSPPTPLPEGEGRRWRVIIPCGWLEAGLAGFQGRARFTRKFGYPGKIDESERVWLTGDRAIGCCQVSLNGQLLTEARSDTFAFDVTKILASRNQVELLIQGDSDQAGLWGEIALEVRKDAFLADIQVERKETSVILTGSVVGEWPQPLELYILVDGRHVDYRTIQPTPDGTPFRIELENVAPSSQNVRVELIQISSIWYVAEVPIPHWHSA